MLVEYDIAIIDGAPDGATRMRIESRYDYAKAKCRCPACGGLGIPWAGWFSCESCCAVALVETGECFVLVP
jgi:hypothetical protein